MRRDPTETLSNAIARDEGGIAVIWCPDLGLRDWLVRETESVLPAGVTSFRTASIEEALTRPGDVALLIPIDEAEVVLELDGSRDRLRGDGTSRTQPIVLFLLRDGDGQKALAQAPSLSSWIRGSDPDPEALAEVDLVAEREAFAKKTDVSPEEWLTRWRRGELPTDGAAHATAYWAMLLEDR